MLKDASNPDLYTQWLESIEARETRATFCYLLGIAASSDRFICHAQWKGPVRDFRFIDVASAEQPYSFITNQRWLLFYFRPPALRLNAVSRDALVLDFDSFHENPAGEWTVKLMSISDVDRLGKHIPWNVRFGVSPGILS